MYDDRDPDGEYDEPDDEPSTHLLYKRFKHKYTPLCEDNICIRKVKKANGKYKRCGNTLFKCDWCKQNLCPSSSCMWQYMIRCDKFTFPLKNHDNCLECGRITCRVHGLCDDCERHHDYDMVTNDVAIGNYRASYAPFDIIVNLNYPRNHMEKDKVVTEKVFGEKTSHVITCGFSDDEHGLTKEKITDLLKRIRHIKKDGDKILFHCYAGISRSTTVAIAYLSGELQHSPQQIYQMILQKRPRIDPNYHFRKAIGIDYA